MDTKIPMLLVATIAAGFAPRSMAQGTNPLRLNSRRPVDVSVEGLGEAARRAPGDIPRGGSIELSVRPSAGGLDTPLDCLESIADQGTGSCLTASSTPTLGMIYPYPGDNNAFTAPAFVGGGQNNQAIGPWSTVAGGRDNTASGYYQSTLRGFATVGGGLLNEATGSGATVGGGRENDVQRDYATVGGGLRNTAAGSIATIGGGYGNSASGSMGTVGGGRSNNASGRYATVGGGGGLVSVGGSSAKSVGNSATGERATVGGGGGNLASGRWATVGGGFGNTASGYRATVGGGGDYDAAGYYAFNGNTAFGGWSTVPGGCANNSMGDFSFSAGRLAKANHAGAFVWADSRFTFTKVSSAADQFNVYASGGVRMFTNSAATTGVLLVPGGGTWTMVSDRDAKENVEPVDARAVLDKVSQLPLATWNYKAQDDSIRHMGPMAQDFYAAFGLGLGDKTIDTLDPNGVALAAIQGLNEVVRENEQRLAEKNAELVARLAEKDAEIEQLRAANDALRQSDGELRQRVERLEALAQAALAK